MKLKHQYAIAFIGLIMAGWGAGMISVHYLIGNSSPINSVNAVGLIIAFTGLAIVIKTLSTLKGIKLEMEYDEE
jgi:hypothetical protein